MLRWNFSKPARKLSRIEAGMISSKRIFIAPEGEDVAPKARGPFLEFVPCKKSIKFWAGISRVPPAFCTSLKARVSSSRRNFMPPKVSSPKFF
ncbi:hypothetical protein D3C87_1289910 [compost metagenome]